MADSVWLLVMFDLPVKTKDQRRSATHYRHLLLDLGFLSVQYSVYCKYLINASGVRALLPPLRTAIPPSGDVRILRLTDEQWASTFRFHGPSEVRVEDQPRQLDLFADEKNALE